MGRLIILITLLLLPMTAVGEDVVKPDAAVQAEIISVIKGRFRPSVGTTQLRPSHSRRQPSVPNLATPARS